MKLTDRETKLAEAIRLRGLGFGWQSIANEIGVHVSTARNWVLKQDLKASPNKRHAARAIDPSNVWTLPINHRSITERRTLFPTRVFDPRDVPRLFVSGHNSPKTGKAVLKGDWAGMPIYTLTLEERATCNPSCFMFRTCYGNGMPFARRIAAGTRFELRLIDEIQGLWNAHPRGFVVRLHILGDFYSVAYAKLWRRLLNRCDALHVFGYTGRARSSPIGRVIDRMNAAHAERCFIRFSSPPVAARRRDRYRPPARSCARSGRHRLRGRAVPLGVLRHLWSVLGAGGAQRVHRLCEAWTAAWREEAQWQNSRSGARRASARNRS